jgi:hypothetical protein
VTSIITPGAAYDDARGCRCLAAQGSAGHVIDRRQARRVFQCLALFLGKYIAGIALIAIGAMGRIKHPSDGITRCFTSSTIDGQLRCNEPHPFNGDQREYNQHRNR